MLFVLCQFERWLGWRAQEQEKPEVKGFKNSRFNKIKIHNQMKIKQGLKTQ